MTKEIRKYVNRCNVCQRNKNCAEAPAGKLIPNMILEKPQRHISADFITKLLLAQGYNVILVVCNQFTKMAYFITTTEKTSVEGLARLFQDQVWWLHRLPESIVLDREPQFIAEIIKELNEILEIKTKLSTAYYPQTDRQTERVNQELEQYLYIFIDHRQKQWPEWLGIVEFVYNNKIHLITKISPFRANCRQDPRIGFKERRRGRYKAAGEFMERMKRIQEKAKAVLKKTQEEIK